MTYSPTAGWIHLFITTAILAIAYLILFGINPAAVHNFLIWIEFSSESPGLSGAFIVFSMMVIFLGGCFVVN
jgi:hypothetical protein